MPSLAGAEPLWDFRALVAAAGGTADGAPGGPVSGFSIDTRTLAAGDVFVALKDQRDGHDFVTTAFERGAAAALVAATYERKPGDGALVRVADPLEGLRGIARAARARLATGARVVAVTGSAGKTGTTTMLRACLSVAGPTHAPEKSYNNHWGVPLTLARMPANSQFAVIEIGMNHADEIRPLVKLARPHVAVVTNVLPVHVGNFDDGEVGVANAKAEIFEGLEPGGTAIILRDSPHYERLAAKARESGATVRSFGRSAGSDVRGETTIADTGAQHIVAHAAIAAGSRDIAYALGIPGHHIATNSLAVVATLDTLSCLSTSTLAPLAAMTPPEGRGGRALIGAGVLLIDESYNANPASMAAALANLGGVSKHRHARRVAVMGDMLELGSEAQRYHRELMVPIELHGIDAVFCCGPNMKALFDALPVERRGFWAANSEALIPHVTGALRTGDAVMVKGSLGSRMAPVVEAIKKRFAGVGTTG